MQSESTSAEFSIAPLPRKWQPLSALARRVLGVLVEKAKTTPEQYPMTLNGICTGCNQKSNRHPQMNVDADDLEPALEQLKRLGAATEVQGSRRVNKYRHFLYDWLGVDKVEAAVMTELLLRGAQTEGELRQRASRMENIADLGALRTVLDSLQAKGLVISLTPQGRGHMVTHALYEPRELEKVRAEAGRMSAAEPPADVAPAAHAPPTAASPATVRESPPPAVRTSTVPPARLAGILDGDLRQQHVELRAELAQLRADFQDLTAELRQCQDEIRQFRNSLGG